MSSSRSEWEKFFKEAGIPSKLVSEYSNIFCENRMRLNMLEELSKEVLQELGIKAIGDIIAIQKYAKIRQKEISRSRSSSPELEIIAKKSTKAATSSSATNTKSKPPVSGPKMPPKLSMTVKADSISNKPSKKNRRTLSDRFNEFETQAKQKKTEEEKEPTGNSSGATTTVTSKPAKQSKPNQTVFTIQVPSKQPSLKQSSQPSSSKQTTTLKAPVNAPKLAAKPPQKVTLVPAQGKTLDRNKQPTSIFDRLDRLTKSTKDKTKDSKEHTKTVLVAPKQGVFSRLGGLEEDDESEATQASSSSKNVFSRLGGR